jgi:hypothetical protein
MLVQAQRNTSLLGQNTFFTFQIEPVIILGTGINFSLKIIFPEDLFLYTPG